MPTLAYIKRAISSPATVMRRGAIVLMGVATLGLTGCQDRSLSDLESYATRILARPGERPEELPPLEPYVVYTYQSTNEIDPFQPFYTGPTEEEKAAIASNNGIKPDFDRNKEELEGHPLDAIRMMGVLEQDETVWGIVRSPDSVIHRVRIGNYLGQNHGKITIITEEAITLSEIVPDGQGGWIERDASLALIE